MKCFLLVLALVVLIGVSSGLSLRSKLKSSPLERRLAERFGKRGGPGGPGGEDRPPFWLSAMLAFGTLAGKCEVASIEIHEIAEETGVNFGEAWAEEMKNMSMLNGACPFVQIFFECFDAADDATKGVMLHYMAPHALDFQCFNLFADLEYMLYVVGGEPAGGFLETRLPLIMECAKLYGDEDQEAQEAEEELDEVEEEEGCSSEKRSSNMRSLLKSLKRLLASSELDKTTIKQRLVSCLD